MVESVPLIPREQLEMFQRASFMTDAMQQSYQTATRVFDEKARKSLNVERNGSNLWKILLLNQKGIRTATLSELDLIADTAPSFLEGRFEDAPAVVLRSVGDSYEPNDYLAKQLFELINRKYLSNAVVIEGLGIKEDGNSHYGVSFTRLGNFKVFEAPDFNHKNNSKRFRKINPDYTIGFDPNGKRRIITREQGISRLDMEENFNVSSDNEDLAFSYHNGRVVIVSSKANAQKI